MATQNLTAAQQAEIQSMISNARDYTMLENEIDRIDSEIRPIDLKIANLSELEATTEKLWRDAERAAEYECSQYKRHKKEMDCRSKWASAIMATNVEWLGISESLALYVGKKENLQNRKNSIRDVKNYKKVQVADSIKILAEMGIDARANLSGSILNGIANVAGAVGNAASGQQSGMVGGYIAPSPVIDNGVTDMFLPKIDPVTGEDDYSYLFMWGALLSVAFVGLILFVKKFKK